MPDEEKSKSNSLGKKVGVVGLIIVMITILPWLKKNIITVSPKFTQTHYDIEKKKVSHPMTIRTDGWSHFDTHGKPYSVATVDSNGITPKYLLGINDTLAPYLLPASEKLDMGDYRKIRIYFVRLMPNQGCEQTTIYFEEMQ